MFDAALLLKTFYSFFFLGCICVWAQYSARCT